MPAWYNFFINEPLNSAVLGLVVVKKEDEQQMEALVYDKITYDDLPVIVAWDNVEKKVGH